MNPEVHTSEDNIPATPSKKRFNRKRLVMVLILVGVVAGVAIVVKNLSDSNNKTNSETVELQIKITKDGFEPATITINPGTKITWTNTDSAPHLVASNPFPKNDGLANFDSKEAIGPGGTYSFTFDKTGTFGYHDQYRPTTNGAVIVQE